MRNNQNKVFASDFDPVKWIQLFEIIRSEWLGDEDSNLG